MKCHLVGIKCQLTTSFVIFTYNKMPPHWNKISTRHLVCDLGKLHLHRASLLLGLEHLPDAEIRDQRPEKTQGCLYASSLQSQIENYKKWRKWRQKESGLPVSLLLCRVILKTIREMETRKDSGLPVSFLLCRVVLLSQQHHLASRLQTSLSK